MQDASGARVPYTGEEAQAATDLALRTENDELRAALQKLEAHAGGATAALPPGAAMVITPPGVVMVQPGMAPAAAVQVNPLVAQPVKMQPV
jgi:hypothetical protein